VSTTDSPETTELSGAAGAATVARETITLPGEGPVSRETTPVSPSVAARVVLLPIRAYRRFLSPALGARCRYYPTCSAYAEASIRELGALRGTILAVWRVLRCNPLSKGGLDPISERRLFRSAAPAPHAHAHAEGGST